MTVLNASDLAEKQAEKEGAEAKVVEAPLGEKCGAVFKKRKGMRNHRLWKK